MVRVAATRAEESVCFWPEKRTRSRGCVARMRYALWDCVIGLGSGAKGLSDLLAHAERRRDSSAGEKVMAEGVTRTVKKPRQVDGSRCQE